ncbi:MAG: ABC transporter transmembrane domain-containing protein [Mastigocoleus sp.]
MRFKFLLLLNTSFRLIPIIIILGLASSLFEGIGISLFIPLLQDFQESGSENIATTTFISTFVENIFRGLSKEKQIIAIAASIFFSILIKNIISYSNNVVFSWYKSRIGHQLRSKIFGQFLNVSYSFIEKQESGKLMNILAYESWQNIRALEVLVNIIINSCTIIVFAALMLLISWQLTLLVGLMTLVISIVIQLVSREVKYLGQKAVEANKNLTTKMWEGFAGMKVIRIFGREDYEKKYFDRASEKVANVFFHLDIFSGISNPLSEVLSATLLLGILTRIF